MTSQRKLDMAGTNLTVRKRAKRMPDTLVETTVINLALWLNCNSALWIRCSDPTRVQPPKNYCKDSSLLIGVSHLVVQFAYNSKIVLHSNKKLLN